MEKRIAEISQRYPTATLSFLIGSMRYREELIIIGKTFLNSSAILEEIANSDSHNALRIMTCCLVGSEDTASLLPAVKDRQGSSISKDAGGTLFLCRSGVCHEPVHSVQALLKQYHASKTLVVA